ncbi:MAG: response regulator transcription factor [Lacibacter sp.]|nr:response regulator transcription factor [Lacibacter sp.]
MDASDKFSFILIFYYHFRAVLKIVIKASRVFRPPLLTYHQQPYIRMAMRRFLQKYKHIFLYAASMVGILIVLQLLQYKLVLINHSYELYILSIAAVFTGLGIWLALKLMKPKTEIQTVVVEKKLYVKELTDEEKQQLETERQKLGLSSRELEVLQLMAEGLSNQEIAERLFLSLATVKTHSSNLFEKLDVKRRTQAVEKARQLKLIA